MRRLDGRGGILGMLLSIDAGGFGDRAGRGGTAGTVWVDIMEDVLKLRDFNISLGPTSHSPMATCGNSLGLFSRFFLDHVG